MRFPCPVDTGDNKNGEPDRQWCLSQKYSLPRMTAGTLNARTLPAGVDLIVAAHSHDFINAQTLPKKALGGIGYRPSLLPLHRGHNAVYCTIHTNDKFAGGTAYCLSDKIDGGSMQLRTAVLCGLGTPPWNRGYETANPWAWPFYMW